jgi:hypothetical protein
VSALLKFLAPRLRVWKEVVWRPWVTLVAVLYALAQLYQWGKGEWLTPDAQERWRLPNILPSWPWWGWLIGWLFLCLVMVLEGAFRTIRERDAKLLEQAEVARARLLSEPKLEVVFAGKCTDCFEGGPLGRVNIGVWNSGATAEDVRVYLIALDPGPTFGKVQLPWVGDGLVGIRIHKSIESGHHHAMLLYGVTGNSHVFSVNNETGVLSDALRRRVQYEARLLVEATNIAPVVVKVIIDPTQKPPVMRVSSNIGITQ